MKFYIIYMSPEGLKVDEIDDMPNLEVKLAELNTLYMKKSDVLSEPKVIYGNQVNYETALICKITG